MNLAEDFSHGLTVRRPTTRPIHHYLVRCDGVEPPEPFEQKIYSLSRYPYGLTTHYLVHREGFEPFDPSIKSRVPYRLANDA